MKTYFQMNAKCSPFFRLANSVNLGRLRRSSAYRMTTSLVQRWFGRGAQVFAHLYSTKHVTTQE